MRRSDTLIKAIAVILFTAILCYFGIHIFNLITKPLQTVIAVNTVITESAPAEGYVIRDERVLSGSGVISPIANGQKVSAGGIVAVSYASQYALEQADAVLSTKERIEYLENMISGRSTGDIPELIKSINISLAKDDMDSLESDIYNAEYAVLDIEEDTDPVSELEQLKDKLEQLESVQTGSTNIYAETSGLFISSTDGFESVSSGDLVGLTPESLKELFSTPQKQACFGKLVHGTKWYFAAIMDAEKSDALKVGENAHVVFTKNYSADISMTVEQICKVRDDERVVVFSTEYDLDGISSVRELGANVIFSSDSGISVPRSAIHTDKDGEDFVYILIGYQAKRVNVDIVLQYDNSHVLIVPDTGSILNDGSEIIVKGKNLSNGAIVR